MRRRAAMALAGAFLAAAAVDAAAAEGCWPPREADAVAVRVLQSELTVGALACGMPKPYAAFIQRQGDALSRHGAALIDYYARTYGETDGPRALDALVTRLANEASTRKVDWPAGYCEFMQALLDRAAATPSDRLARFAASQPHARRTLRAGACGR